MANIEIPVSPVYNNQMESIEITTPVHADIMNAKFQQVLTNEEALKKDIQDANDKIDTQKANKSTIVSVTLTASGWVGSAAPYTQSVAVVGILAATNSIVEIAPSATLAQYTAGADAQLHPTAQTDGSITITAFDTKPSIDIPIVVCLLG